VINSKYLEHSSPLVKIHGNVPEGTFQICTDSRKYQSGELFYSINGEKFDGFDYVENVLSHECPIVVFESSEKNSDKLKQLDQTKTCFIEVVNTIDYLQSLAIKRRDEFKQSGGVILGITGSNGKTSHKEMMKAMLESVFGDKVHSTKGNLNNHIGVPLTLLDLKENHSICILEMGTNHPGEIPALCKLGDHDHGLITNIGASHLEFFHTEANVFKEKRALFDHVQAKGTGKFVVPGSDPFLSTLEGKTLSKTSYSKTGNKVEFEVDGTTFEFETDKLGGNYNYSNMVTCLSLLCLVYPEHAEKFLESASKYELPEMNRANWVEKGGKRIFLDAYNANPSSMKVSLDYFNQFLKSENVSSTKSLWFLGDMNELGDKSAEYHKEIGAILKSFGHKNLVFVGRYASDYLDGAEAGQKFETVEKVLKEGIETSGISHVFIKGSRSLQLESLLDIF